MGQFRSLFMVSLLPFATAWVARSKLASSPVALYARLFIGIDIAYNVFERHVLANADTGQARTRASFGKTAIPFGAGGFHGGTAGRLRRTPSRLRPDLRIADASPAARHLQREITSMHRNQTRRLRNSCFLGRHAMTENCGD